MSRPKETIHLYGIDEDTLDLLRSQAVDQNISLPELVATILEEAVKLEDAKNEKRN